MLPRDPRVALRWRLLQYVPLPILFTFNTGWAYRRKLDYQRADIVLHVRSKAEAKRLRSCAKEPWTIQWIEQALQPGDVLFDIGANVGAYALVAAKHTRGQARIVAFEPGYASFAALCENILLNDCAGAITPLPVGLAARTSLGAVRCHGLDVRLDHSRSAGHRAAWLLVQSYEQPALMLALDDVIGQFGLPRPTHIRLSVGNATLDTLMGAARTLTGGSVRSLSVKADPNCAEKIIQYLGALGFALSTQSRGVTDSQPFWAGVFTRFSVPKMAANG